MDVLISVYALDSRHNTYLPRRRIRENMNLSESKKKNSFEKKKIKIYVNNFK
jgi:hypothetical protein